MCCVVEVAPSILPLTLILNFCLLYLYSYTIPPSHTPLSFLSTDREISHQWSGNQNSWDSIYQHQRKPQMLLVKLLTNILNTMKRLVCLTRLEIPLLLAPSSRFPCQTAHDNALSMIVETLALVLPQNYHPLLMIVKAFWSNVSPQIWVGSRFHNMTKQG